MEINQRILDVTKDALDSNFIKRDMPELDTTPTTIEVPRYLKADLRALASYHAKPGHTPKMKAYLIDLIAAEKKKAKL